MQWKLTNAAEGVTCWVTRWRAAPQCYFPVARDNNIPLFLLASPMCLGGGSHRAGEANSTTLITLPGWQGEKGDVGFSVVWIAALMVISQSGGVLFILIVRKWIIMWCGYETSI